jgi:hypothetical protein
MVFKAEKSFPIPNKDLLSWTFDDNKADPNEPVSHATLDLMETSGVWLSSTDYK